MRALLVAELSANHNQDISIAKQSILAAKKAGADAIKIQTYTPDTITIDCDNEYFQITQGTIWDGTTLYKLYQQAYTPFEWHEELFEYAREIGIEIFSTPFDFTAVDLLESLNNPIYKIASFEITDIPLIKYAASKGRPMIVSTGIATYDEIIEAVDACRSVGNNDITLLQCTSQYPAKPEDANVATMNDLRKLDVKVGLSDHTMGSEVAEIAVAAGAAVIEKHFIVDRNIGGPDSSFSMEPTEFADMVQKIRRIESILGNVTYEMTEKKKANRAFSRSLFVVEDVKAGDIISERNVKSIRPSAGMKPIEFDRIKGLAFNRDIMKGTPMKEDFIK